LVVAAAGADGVVRQVGRDDAVSPLAAEGGALACVVALPRLRMVACGGP